MNVYLKDDYVKLKKKKIYHDKIYMTFARVNVKRDHFIKFNGVK